MRFRTRLVFAALAAGIIAGTTALCAPPAAGNMGDPYPQWDNHGRDGTLDNQGGPDAFQYMFTDNVPYEWIELRGDSEATWLRGLTDFTSIADGYSRRKLPIGFSFPFYGASYDCVRVATNGFLQFTTTATWLNNMCLPSTLVAGPMIAVLWDDFHLLRGGRTDTAVIGYRSFGTHMVIEFDQIGFFSTSCPNVPLKFEAILYPNGDIKLQYASVPIPMACANSQTIGIQQAGAAGSAALNYVCNTTGIQPGNGRAILFSCAGGVPNPVTNLTGQYVAPNVVLNWMDPTEDVFGNPITIDNVQVWVGAVGSGRLLATVARGVQTCTEASPPNGPRLYHVRAYRNPFYSAAVSCSAMVGCPSYFSDFEDDNGEWVADPALGGWEWGTPTVPATLVPHSGTKVWGTLLDANYPNRACLTLTLSPGLVVWSPTASVEFWRWYDIQSSYDGCNFFVSVDNGTTWQVVQPTTGGYTGSTHTANTCNPSLPAWTGNYGTTWTYVVIPIGQFVGRTLMFRFTFGSNASTQYPGFFFDDMFIWGLRPPSGATGVVRAFQTGMPIPDARVWAHGAPDTVTTDSTGSYMLLLDPGTYTLGFRHIHFCDTTCSSVAVDSGSHTVCDVQMRAPRARLSRTSLTLLTTMGVDVIDTFGISNPGGQCPLSFIVSDTSAWLSVEPAGGSVAPNQSTVITVRAAVAGLAVGDYGSAVVVSCNAVGSPSTIRVDLYVGPSAADASLSLPSEFACYPNYPNPFNAQTSLRFDVPQQSRVQIVIYSVMGQEVARPVDGVYAPGRHQALFDAGDLPSGMYLARMSAAGYTQIGKMMLLK